MRAQGVEAYLSVEGAMLIPNYSTLANKLN
jgi:hypothetical protein